MVRPTLLLDASSKLPVVRRCCWWVDRNQMLTKGIRFSSVCVCVPHGKIASHCVLKSIGLGAYELTTTGATQKCRTGVAANWWIAWMEGENLAESSSRVTRTHQWDAGLCELILCRSRPARQEPFLLLYVYYGCFGHLKKEFGGDEPPILIILGKPFHWALGMGVNVRILDLVDLVPLLGGLYCEHTIQPTLPP